jgi:CRISPR-associated protein Cmr4
MSDTAILFLHALTGLHPGSGTALGVVDLPVQRERHTGWPTIPGTSLKGVLKSEAFRARSRDEEDRLGMVSVFGPDTKSASDHAGALALTDARLLAFPVRSLKGVFSWVTCPAVVARFQRDLSVAGARDALAIPTVREGEALVVAVDGPLCDQGQVVFEEFDFTAKPGAKPVADWIAARAVRDAATRARVSTHLAIVSDDAFTHFVRHSTEITARIALDYETKTVRDGALFYEEFLPPETLFYALAIAQPSRNKKFPMTASEVIDWVEGLELTRIQVGAGETIGKGFCAVSWHRADGDGR